MRALFSGLDTILSTWNAHLPLMEVKELPRTDSQGFRLKIPTNLLANRSKYTPNNQQKPQLPWRLRRATGKERADVRGGQGGACARRPAAGARSWVPPPHAVVVTLAAGPSRG